MKEKGGRRRGRENQKIKLWHWSIQGSQGSYHLFHAEKSSERYLSKARKNIEQGADVG